MKTIRKVLLVIAVCMLAACSNPKTLENPAFSVEIPAGYSQEKDQISIPDYSESIVMNNSTGGVSVIAFPKGPDVEKFLYAQSFGGANTELHECTFSNLSETEIDSRKVAKVDLDGRIAGKETKGTIYAFEDGNYLFLVMGFGSDGTPDDIEHIISTIKAKPDSRTDEEIDSARLAAIIKVSSGTLPRTIDEVTIWKGVHVDDSRNCIVMDMEINGNSKDLDTDFFQGFLNNNRDNVVIPTFREQRSADYLIEIPAKLGYDFEYVYTTSEDGKIIGRMHIDNSQITE